MGEKDTTKNEIEKKAAVAVEVASNGVSEKKQDEPITVELRLELHCEGCAKKVRRSISNLKGVEKVKADCKAKKLTVTGNVDPTWLRDGVETKTKKKVELISHHPQKDDGGADDKPAAQTNKTEENKSHDDHDNNNKKPKETAVSTVVLKTKLHCDDCAHKIKRIIFKNFEGNIESVTTELPKDLIMVTGMIEAEKLVTYLREKLKRQVDIIPPHKDNAAAGKQVVDDGGDDKTEKKESGGGGEEKKKEDKNMGEEAAKVEVNKMEHSSNYNISQTHYAMAMAMPMTMPMYSQSYNDHHDGHGMVAHHHEYPISHSNAGYMVQHPYGPPVPPPTYLNTESDLMFSDENPNGCSIM